MGSKGSNEDLNPFESCHILELVSVLLYFTEVGQWGWRLKDRRIK